MISITLSIVHLFLAREGGNNVIKLSTGNELVELSSTSPEIGTVKEEVTANDVEGGNLKFHSTLNT